MKKGFASMTIVYSFLIVFIMLLLVLLSLYTRKSRLVDSIVSEAKEQLIKDITIEYSDNNSNIYKWKAPLTAYYEIELCGAQGGGSSEAGSGGCTKGIIKLLAGEILYIYVGGTPDNSNGGFNGGGSAQDYGGGGATDIRLVSGNWNNAESLNSRIMVAAGGGGQGERQNGGHGGGLEGENAEFNDQITGGTQTSGGANSADGSANGLFGIGADEVLNANTNTYNGGGGGYYGGASSTTSEYGGAGGSSFISGHTGCVAIESRSDISQPRTARKGTNEAGCTTGTSDNLCSIHYSGKYFVTTEINEANNAGAGYAKITYKGDYEYGGE